MLIRSVGVALAVAGVFLVVVAIVSGLQAADVAFGVVFGIAVGLADYVRRRRRASAAG